MSRVKILICDDNPTFAKGWAEEIKSSKDTAVFFDAEVMYKNPNDLFEDLKLLINRQSLFRKGENWQYDETRFDDASIVIIDFEISTKNNFVSGESLAYLVRCFSNCKIIIGMNQYSPNSFDLTLRGHPESYCDFNIGERQLGNPGLWVGAKTNFRPWYWMNILENLKYYERKVEELKSNINNSIIDTLHLKPALPYLPKSALDFLGQEPDKVTFQKFCFESKYGFHIKDRKDSRKLSDFDIEILARFCVSRLSKWLLRMVLPGQDVIVDAPHLVSRFPSLLKDNDLTNLELWNQTTAVNVADLKIDNNLIHDFEYSKPYWISRPVWFWSNLARYEKIDEVREPWARHRIGIGFCEDASQFFSLDDCREFVADVDSPYKSRYVRMTDTSVEYEPSVRLIIPDDDD